MPIWDAPGQMQGTVTAVSGNACTVSVLGSDNAVAVPVGTTVAVGDVVVLFSIGSTWYVNAVLPQSGS